MRPWMIAGMAMGTGAALLSAGCGAPASRASANPVEPIPEVEFVRVRSSAAGPAPELPGAMASSHTVMLNAPSAGQICELAEVGARLSEGQMAVMLEATGLPETVTATRAALDAALSRQDSAATAVDQALRLKASSSAELTEALKVAEAARDRQKAQLAEAQHQGIAEPARLKAQVLAAEARVRLLKSGERIQRIKQLEAEVDVGKAEVSVAESQLRRVKELYAAGLAARREMETAALTLRRARANVVQLDEELKLQTEGAHPEAIKEAEEQAEAARQSLRGAAGLNDVLTQRRAELASAEAEVNRVRQKLETANSDALSIQRARQEAATAAAESRRLRAQLNEAQNRASRSTMKAPFAGQVVRRFAQPGETVAAGAPLMEIVDPNHLQFRAGLSESEQARFKAGTRVQVRVPAVSAGWRPGQVLEVVQAADPTHPYYEAHIRIPDSKELKPGMAGSLQLTGTSVVNSSIRLPITSLRKHFPRERRAEVWVLEGDRLRVRPVRLSAVRGSTIEVSSGLRSGDKVVTSELPSALPEGPVRSREVGAP